MLGDHTLFSGAEGIESLWEKSEPLLQNPPPVRPYAPGSWGPDAIDAVDRTRRLAPPLRTRVAHELSGTVFDSARAGPIGRGSSAAIPDVHILRMCPTARGGAVMTSTETSFCRLCTALCPIVVTIEDGRAGRGARRPGRAAVRRLHVPEGAGAARDPLEPGAPAAQPEEAAGRFARADRERRSSSTRSPSVCRRSSTATVRARSRCTRARRTSPIRRWAAWRPRCCARSGRRCSSRRRRSTSPGS